MISEHVLVGTQVTVILHFKITSCSLKSFIDLESTTTLALVLAVILVHRPDYKRTCLYCYLLMQDVQGIFPHSWDGEHTKC
jgi:hypothetical protein